MVATLFRRRAVCLWWNLSVRFSSRQWLLPYVKYILRLCSASFSPLFIAAMVATHFFNFIERSVNLLSVRFSSRQWLLLHEANLCRERTASFQSAFHRGNGCYSPYEINRDFFDDLSVRFSSRQWLLPFRQCHGVIEWDLSVRFSSRQWLLPVHQIALAHNLYPFSPLFIAAMVAT